jgi:hypothetical protein
MVDLGLATRRPSDPRLWTLKNDSPVAVTAYQTTMKGKLKMNRHERRRQRVMHVVTEKLLISVGRGNVEAEATTVLTCCHCEATVHPWPWTDGPEGCPPTAVGLARINDMPTSGVLCETCLNLTDITERLAHMVTGADVIEHVGGGEAHSTEKINQLVAALREQERSSSH